MSMTIKKSVQHEETGAHAGRGPRRSGYTLMEVLLGIALISILAAGGMWLLFLQQGAYSMTSQRNDAMARLTATYQLMFKEIHTLNRSAVAQFTPSPSAALPHDRVSVTGVAPHVFQYDPVGATVLWNGNPILADVLATFTFIGVDQPVNLQVVSVELQHRATGDRLNFLVAPRNP